MFKNDVRQTNIISKDESQSLRMWGMWRKFGEYSNETKENNFALPKKRDDMSEFEIRQSIRQAIDDMTLAQQMKLLEFINAMLAKPKVKKGAGILQFAGIFDKKDTVVL